MGFDVVHGKGASLGEWLREPMDYLSQGNQREAEVELEAESLLDPSAKPGWRSLPALAVGKAGELLAVAVQKLDLVTQVVVEPYISPAKGSISGN